MDDTFAFYMQLYEQKGMLEKLQMKQKIVDIEHWEQERVPPYLDLVAL